jgi:hypothetical protein
LHWYGGRTCVCTFAAVLGLKAVEIFLLIGVDDSGYIADGMALTLGFGTGKFILVEDLFVFIHNLLIASMRISRLLTYLEMLNRPVFIIIQQCV